MNLKNKSTRWLLVLPSWLLMGIVAIFFKENTINEVIVFFFGGWTVAWYIIITNYDFKKWKEELFNKHKIL